MAIKVQSAGLAPPGRFVGSLRLFSIALLLVWTAVIGLSLWHNLSSLEEHARDSARLQAMTAFEKDVICRRWNSLLGGVFALVQPEKLQPNPYLNPKGREIYSADGLVYTRVNPAFMTRLVHEIGELRTGVLGHITSNKPIRPGNAPDPWEKNALALLESGAVNEVSELLDINGKAYLRYISGLPTEESCLSCHASQGYRVGDIRGGISVSVPMAPFFAVMRSSQLTLWATHGVLWVLGLLGLSFGGSRLSRRIAERDAAEAQLRELARELEERVALRTAALNARQQELQAFVDNVAAGVFLKDVNGIYQFANARFASMFALEPGAVLQRTNADIFSAPLAASLDNVEKRVISTLCGEEYRDKAALDNCYSFFIFPVTEGKTVRGLGGLVVDTSERDRTERALREARDAAEKANKAKSDFLANMSHEIRTPLNGVIGMADILLRTKLNTEQTSMASAIKASGDSLLLVLNDILDLSKIESGRFVLDMAPFKLRDVLFTATRAVTHIAYKKGIELILDIEDAVPEHLFGDSMRIRQIVLNLANNALKFTEQGEVLISVRLESRDSRGARLGFAVRDTGIGISPEKHQSVFNSFEQVDTSITRKYGGTGLGLAICSSFVRMMNSSIELESAVGEGSCFRFSLYLPLASGEVEEPLPSLEGKKILLADQNRKAVQLLVQALEKAGARVDAAGSSDEVRQVAENRYDAVVFGHRFLEAYYAELMGMQGAFCHAVPSTIVLLAEGLVAPDVREIFESRLDKPVRPEELVRLLALRFSNAETQTGQQDVEAEKSVSLNILLVEDVELNRIVATHMFNELGHRVTEVENGAEALALLERQSFDLVFMDIQMPVMDGIAATEKLREMERLNPDMPRSIIIAMTANALKGDRDKYMEAGMDDYVSKPFHLESIRAVIARYKG